MVEYHITQAKKESLEAELHTLTHITRPDILEKLDAARSLGDLKENAEYHAMRDAQGMNESRIQEIEELLKFAVIVEKHNDGIVALASEVTVTKGDSNTKLVFTIVSPQESDISTGKIADNSPLGQALMGKKKGNVVLFETPKGSVEYTIKKVD